MRVLLDECLPRKLAFELPGHEVSTVAGVGWSGTKNGALLRRTAGSYDVFVTIDKRLHEQQRIPTTLAVVTLVAYSNRMASLRPLIPSLLETPGVILPGQVKRISA